MYSQLIQQLGFRPIFKIFLAYIFSSGASFLTLWTLEYIKLVIDYWQSGFYSCLREDYKMY